jgi:hypothetical protein
MQHLLNIVSAVAHDLEPAPRDGPQFTWMLIHPGLDRRIARDGTGEPQEPAHGDPASTPSLTAGISPVAVSSASTFRAHTRSFICERTPAHRDAKVARVKFLGRHTSGKGVEDDRNGDSRVRHRGQPCSVSAVATM